ncbi:hypothetical protein LY76DRAFT_637699 [Colletotrichum caudatum]|nr:hypothetical protein LY76DRAFT_637699 [Colletotrichum caudatum]
MEDRKPLTSMRTRSTSLDGAAGDVFALGVVLLFVLRKAPYPEMRQPRLHWIIADVRKTGAAAKSALESMTQWLRLVGQTSRELLRDDRSKLEWLAARMVDSNVTRRITVEDLIKHAG